MVQSLTSDLRASASPIPITLDFRERMLAGAIARGIAQTVLHPVDVIRTRLQARDLAASWRPGVFIKGVIPQISLAIPAGAIQFLAFESAKENLSKLFPDEKLSQARVLVAGAFGALAAAVCRVPQEVLKQTIQADVYPNIFVALRETIGKKGIGAVYNGWFATISRDVPWNALSFLFHAQGKRIFKSVKGRMPENDENLVVAGIAGAIAAIIMTPVDVVKTRIMTQKAGAAVQYSGIIGTLRKIVAEEGANTLMKGVVPRILFLAPLAGITFSVYEAVAEKIKRRKISSALPTAHAPVLDEADEKSLVVNKEAEKLRKRKAFAVRFSKTPVRLASSSISGQFIGDYATASPIFFSLAS